MVVDPNTAGVYDTIYVDLNDDYDFSDEKPVTQGVAAVWRDLNGDGYVDLSGGMPYYISDGATKIPGGPTSFGVRTRVPRPARSSRGPETSTRVSRDTARCCPNIVGQGVTNGGLPTFRHLPVGKVPGAVVGGAPRREAGAVR